MRRQAGLLWTVIAMSRFWISATGCWPKKATQSQTPIITSTPQTNQGVSVPDTSTVTKNSEAGATGSGLDASNSTITTTPVQPGSNVGLIVGVVFGCIGGLLLILLLLFLLYKRRHRVEKEEPVMKSMQLQTGRPLDAQQPENIYDRESSASPDHAYAQIPASNGTGIVYADVVRKTPSKTDSVSTVQTEYTSMYRGSTKVTSPSVFSLHNKPFGSASGLKNGGRLTPNGSEFRLGPSLSADPAASHTYANVDSGIPEAPPDSESAYELCYSPRGESRTTSGTCTRASTPMEVGKTTTTRN